MIADKIFVSNNDDSIINIIDSFDCLISCPPFEFRLPDSVEGYRSSSIYLLDKYLDLLVSKIKRVIITLHRGILFNNISARIRKRLIKLDVLNV